jgi:PAS domain S-box-containing protein
LEEFISVNADTRPGKVVALWRWLTEPAALADAAWTGDAGSLDAGNAIQIQDERERSRLLASMIIVILPTIVLVGMVLMPLVSRADSLWQSATFLPATIATIGSVVAFGLNRGGHFRPAAAVYTFVFVAAPILAVSRSSGLMNVSIGTLSVGGVIIASALSRHLTGPALAAAGAALGVLLIPLVDPATSYANLAALFSVILTLSLLVLVFTDYRNWQEEQRQAALRDSIQQSNARLGELLETITALAALDFNAQAPVGPAGDTFDALAAGLNALGEALEASTVSRDFLNRIITSMADSLIVVDQSGLISIANRATLMMLRTHEPELIGAPLSQVLGEEVAVDQLAGRAEERFYLPSDGRPIPVFFSAAALPGPGGGQGGLVCLARDISVQKQAEELIRQNLRELALLNRTIGAAAESLDIGAMLESACRELVTAMAASGAIAVLVNRESRQLRLGASWGVQSDGRVDSLPQEFSYHLPLIQELFAVRQPLAVDDVATEPELAPLQDYFAGLDVASLMLIPLVVRDQVSGIIGLMSSDPAAFNQRALELAANVAATVSQALHNAQLYNELEEYNRTLEETVQARTAALQEANEHLQTLSRAKDEFVSNVSHELRTPISSMKLYLGMLEKVPERVDRYLGTLLREASRLERTIEDLLSLSRIDQERITFEREAVDLNDLAREIVADRLLLAEAKSQNLRLGELADGVEIIGDPTLLGQVLSILLTNAIAYTPAGGTIQVATQIAEHDEQPWAGIYVQDNGPGVAPEEQARLFERFYRGQIGLDSGIQGTGLGLAIASEIVRRHQGRLEVESDGVFGRGTTFCIWLPARVSEREQVAGPVVVD